MNMVTTGPPGNPVATADLKASGRISLLGFNCVFPMELRVHRGHCAPLCSRLLVRSQLASARLTQLRRDVSLSSFSDRIIKASHLWNFASVFDFLPYLLVPLLHDVDLTTSALSGSCEDRYLRTPNGTCVKASIVTPFVAHLLTVDALSLPAESSSSFT